MLFCKLIESLLDADNADVPTLIYTDLSAKISVANRHQRYLRLIFISMV
jgi:hypothetical protein